MFFKSPLNRIFVRKKIVIRYRFIVFKLTAQITQTQPKRKNLKKMLLLKSRILKKNEKTQARAFPSIFIPRVHWLYFMFRFGVIALIV